MIDYRNKEDVRLLATQLLAIPEEFDTSVVAFITDKDLMRPQWWVRAFLAVARWCKGNTLEFWIELEKRDPGQAQALIVKTAYWMLYGKDTSTPDAAGGMNQKELMLIESLCQSFEKLPK